MTSIIIYNNHIFSKQTYSFTRITFVGDKMENICSEYYVSYNEKNIGKAKIEKVGIRFAITAEIKECGAKTPFRLAAECEGRIVPLGVMLPKDGGYNYRKTFTSGALRELGISAIKGFTIIVDTAENKLQPTEPMSVESAGWISETDPGSLLEEGEFRRLFSACKETLVRCEDEITYLAVPIVKGEEFPVMPVFCLGEAWKINGGLYIVFKIHNGKLTF